MTTPASLASPVLDRSTIRANLVEFKSKWLPRIAQWKTEKRAGTESSHDQQFWAGLLGCFGVNAQERYLYQRSAKRASTGRTGKIDLFWPGKVIGEAKSLGIGLDAAYTQALDYLTGGTIPNSQQPGYVVCTNFETLRVTRLSSALEPDADTWDETFALADIDDHLEQLIFLADYETTAYRREEQASAEAIKLMVELFRAMNGDDVDEGVGEDAPTNPEDEDARTFHTSVYLTRILFLLFGDDSGLWDKNLFHDFVRNETTPETLGMQLGALFGVLNTPEDRRHKNLPGTLARFPYVNGGLFSQPAGMEYFDTATRDALLAACNFDWSTMSVAAFGSMFQLVKSKEARRGDGEHYTSETNIMKTIGPLFLDELRAEATRLVSNPSTPVTALERFRDSLAELTFLDPACGAGNFLIVAYRELRKIETDVIVAIRQRQGETGMSLNIEWEQKLTIDQFHGFEINWWPAKIAETVMFLVDHQANRELAQAVGQAPQRLPITMTAHIRHGNALAIAWDTELPRRTGQTFIFGNPPFKGDDREKAQKEDLAKAWEGKTDAVSRLDFVTAWHAKSLDFYATGHTGAFAFVTTNSITQGDQVPRLFGAIFAEGWRIRFAHRTFAWDSEAPGKAAVHCVIIGFDKETSPRPRLWDYRDVKGEPELVPVEHQINAYLIDGPHVLIDKTSAPLSPVINTTAYGSKPTDDGNLIVKPEEYDTVMADPIAATYVHRYLGAKELLHGADRWCLWLVDSEPQEREKSAVLAQRLAKVKAFREASKAVSTRDYARCPHLFRQLAKQDTDFLCIPIHVSEKRRYFPAQRCSADVIASNANFQTPDPDGLQFALISSSMFITWQKAVGGRIKSDLRFGSTLTWYTFPVPDLEESQRVKIIAAGHKVLDARALHPERALAEHYTTKGMDPALVKAHDALDREVDKAFGAARKLTHERQRLELLFSHYVALTQGEK